MANIVMTTHWSDGDVLPFIKAGKYLRDRGHDVTIVTHCIYKQKVCQEKLHFVAWETQEEYDSLMKGMESYNENMMDQEKIREFRTRYQSVEIRVREYRLLETYCKKENTILIAKNRSDVAALAVAEAYQCPLIWVYMNPYEYGSVANFSAINEKELVEESNCFRTRIGLKPVKSWLEWQNAPKIKVGFWPSWFFSSIAPQPKDMNLVGFPLEQESQLDWKLDTELLRILKSSKPSILITGGTSKTLNEQFYKCAMEACVNYPGNVIVVCKHREFLKNINVADNFYVFNYIPLYQAMKYVRIVIHHGGIGTASDALYNGVPQLILGDSVDRPLNGEIIQSNRVGKYLPPHEWHMETIQRYLQILGTDEFRNYCRKFSNTHRNENVFETFCELVEKCMYSTEYNITYEYIDREKRDKNTEASRIDSMGKQTVSKEIKNYLVFKMKNRMEKRKDL